MNRSVKGDILIVDDTLDNLRLLSAMLSENGYDVRSVANGAIALVGIQTRAPDLVLLDIAMPGMNGYQVCERLKSNPTTKEIPIIFISALNEVFDKVKAFSIGGADFITKPFQVEEVLVRIQHQLELRHLQLQLQERNNRLQQAETSLRRSLEQEKSLNRRIEEMTAAEERSRIARDIHDSLGHSLVALKMQIDIAIAFWQDDPERVHTALRESQQLTAESLQAVRQSIAAIRSDPFQGNLLEGAIAHLAEEFHHLTDVQPECQIDLSHPMSNQVNHVVYRIVQEGLTNICKHAEATSVQIHLKTAPEGLSLMLQDNGKGWQCDSAVSGYGLQGMRERIAAVGGQFEMFSEPGAGCRINVYFPRESDSEAAS